MNEIRADLRKRVFAFSLSIAIIAAMLAVTGWALAQPDTRTQGVLTQEAAGTIKILPNPAYVSAGGSVTVDVWLEDVGNYYGIDFRLNFEKARVSVPGGEVTPLWEVFDDSSSFTIKNTVTNLDETYDQVQYAVTNLNPAEPFTGTGRLCSITFSGVSEGVAALDFTYAKASTRDGGTLYPAQADGMVTVTSAAVDIALAEGWSLVSFPLIATTDNPRDLLSHVSENYDLVYAWNSATQTWESLLQALPDPQTLDSLDLTEGFWIHMLAADELRIGGSLPGETSIALNAGWNLVGFPSSAPRAVETALSSIAGKFSLVFEYDAADSVDPWDMYNPNAPFYASTLSELKPGMGYWIKATESCTWVVQY